MSEEFNTATFLKAIPGMLKKVWPGMWVVIVVVPIMLVLTDTTTRVFSLDDFLTIHILLVLGLICLTVWIYNTYERYAANFAAGGLWFFASGLCVLFDRILQLLVAGG